MVRAGRSWFRIPVLGTFFINDSYEGNLHRLAFATADIFEGNAFKANLSCISCDEMFISIILFFVILIFFINKNVLKGRSSEVEVQTKTA